VVANQKEKPMARGDGNLTIAFVEMGQGDCILIACPNGKTAMVDCGTTQLGGASLQEIKDIIYSNDFLLNYNKLDLLILTHPDKAHYNQLVTMLSGQTAIGDLYYSGSKLASYGYAGLRLMILANGASKRKFTQNKASEQKVKQEVLDGGNGCKIYLLAGNVKWESAEKDGNDENNTGSLVTLIEFGNRKILLCGDATKSTEEFLLASFADDIKDLHILQVPDHGSETTSSHPDFVKAVNPEIAIISVAKDSGIDLKLPKFSVVRSYLLGSRMTQQEESFKVRFWKFEAPEEQNDQGQQEQAQWLLTLGEFKKNVRTTGSNGTQQFVITP
jgi:beta-lactamase superfamily II metal-dependent hydrolase